MGRYKGKREASHSGNTEKKKIEADPFERSGPGIGDPFADDGMKKKGGGIKAFFASGKVQILLVALLCIGILGTAAGIAVSMWVREPELPSTDNEQKTPSTDRISTTPNPSLNSTDDLTASDDGELYPDDGYDGDMPAVSGNRKEGVYTFLLVGTDMDDGNTDTIMVASYDTKNQAVSIMSIPRDTMINESWDIKKINSVYSRYKDGMDALKKRIKTLVGFAPDFYVKVDLSMFVELVDLIGGVEFDVPQNMKYDDPYQNLHINLKKGVQTLDGEKAMELVRFRRYSEGDVKRMEVQQNFMKALIKECLSMKNWGKIKSYIDLALENVQTDLEFGSVVWFAANVLGVNSGVSALDMDDVYTCTLPGDYWGTAWSRTTNTQQSYVTIYPKEVVKLVNERFNPYEQKVTTSMLDAMSILSNGTIASSTGSLRDTTHNSVVSGQRSNSSSNKNTNNKTSTATPKDDSSQPKNNDTNEEPILPNTPLNPNSNTTTTKPNTTDTPNTSNNSSNHTNENTSHVNENPETPDEGNSGDHGTAADPSAEPEPQLPDETSTAPVQTTPEPAPEPVPAPAPEPEPVPEPIIDTEIPEWLLA